MNNNEDRDIPFFCKLQLLTHKYIDIYRYRIEWKRNRLWLTTDQIQLNGESEKGDSNRKINGLRKLFQFPVDGYKKVTKFTLPYTSTFLYFNVDNKKKILFLLPPDNPRQLYFTFLFKLFKKISKDCSLISFK